MNAPLFSATLRKSAKWLVLVAIAAVVFYRVKFAARSSLTPRSATALIFTFSPAA